jgi:hypothetical protein
MRADTVLLALVIGADSGNSDQLLQAHGTHGGIVAHQHRHLHNRHLHPTANFVASISHLPDFLNGRGIG